MVSQNHSHQQTCEHTLCHTTYVGRWPPHFRHVIHRISQCSKRLVFPTVYAATSGSTAIISSIAATASTAVTTESSAESTRSDANNDIAQPPSLNQDSSQADVSTHLRQVEISDDEVKNYITRESGMERLRAMLTKR